jgi:signal transduction histidine kinase
MVGSLADVDPDRLVQAVQNLLDNAAKYSAHGTTITTSVAALGGDLQISVTDQGIGIEPHELAHVFEREFRGIDAVNQGIPGAGLGLAVTQSIAELHCGRVEVRSRVGRGSTFTLIVPLTAPLL